MATHICHSFVDTKNQFETDNIRIEIIALNIIQLATSFPIRTYHITKLTFFSVCSGSGKYATNWIAE
jgi:hypothetical protein